MTEKYDSRDDTRAHIALVKKFADTLAYELKARASQHDRSKLEDPEKSTFDRVTPALKALTYGSEEYQEQLDGMKSALEHHYAHNRHHPEHHPEGMADMTIVDLLEMFCDWAAATRRHDDGCIGTSIARNAKRFGYDKLLAAIFVNTAERYQMGARCDWAGVHYDEECVHDD